MGHVDDEDRKSLHASPEQLAGTEVDASSDIYSLGIVLYELLAGQRPYQSEDQQSEALRVMLGVCPVEPSQVAKTWTFRRKLSGDLDAILLKMLRRAPEERYETPGHLIHDIENYLSCKPVLAYKNTNLYRCEKFFKRHSGVMAALVLIYGVLHRLIKRFPR